MSLTRPTITGYSGFWNTLGEATTYAQLPLAAGGNRSNFDGKIARVFHGAKQLREVRTALLALLGAAAGGSAALTYKRVGNPVGPSATVPLVSSFDELGGSRTIDTITVINRNTTAADLAYIKDLFDGDLTASGLTYADDASMNGAGRMQMQGCSCF